MEICRKSCCKDILEGLKQKQRVQLEQKWILSNPHIHISMKIHQPMTCALLSIEYLSTLRAIVISRAY
jgi:hypothetical protein